MNQITQARRKLFEEWYVADVRENTGFEITVKEVEKRRGDKGDYIDYPAMHGKWVGFNGALGLPNGWRCFQCDEHFDDEESAALHFGNHQRQRPSCLIDVAEYRAMEARMHAYNEEDADIHRAMARLCNQHQSALQREEEKGYARALKDTAYDENPVLVLRRLVSEIDRVVTDEETFMAALTDARALLAKGVQS